ncbi:MAG: class I SAM-dependent methyltransferase [Candidatus Methylumidiphilus sp.]
MDLSYQEKLDKLSIRIRAHKEFANFDIADWIDAFLQRKPRLNILDLGCGNGNHLGLYLKHVDEAGRVFGLDREPGLIEEARSRHAQAGNLFLQVGSMDDPLPFADGQFDLCFSNFAIYNAADPMRTITELKRVMKPAAELVLIGPTRNNAKEIYEFNERLTGTAIDEITLIRTDRLRVEILPIVQTIFANTAEEIINSKLTFPNRDEFIQYFTATMLYEEGAEKQGITIDQMKAACTAEKDIILSKEMLAVVAVKE